MWYSEMRKLVKAEADNNGRREMKSVEVRSFSNTAVYSQQACVHYSTSLQLPRTVTIDIAVNL